MIPEATLEKSTVAGRTARAAESMRPCRTLLTAGALLWAIVSALGGCAKQKAVRALGDEQVLLTAGFVLAPAKSPAERARLAALPKRQIVAQPGPPGEPTFYIFADPENCCCMYVGTATDYVAYKALRERIDRERNRDGEAILFGDSAMDADVPPDYPKLDPLPANASQHGCPD